ncbi:hypothetical protein G3R49_12695 [Shewanella sp. WXL01]|uniref:Uncharacterized protein n=1 Tax=Shewanella maritima TaxID=2520507 RepID=A0A411PJD5_9GAMM|nr:MULTISPECIES: hypothetical protein [Shewanella]NKF51417.1 hypothetical protein [Shewanella sp. WXL01]QBF83669.1 hypothetical protein EXU30_13910 [Shewanella maritima]
MQIGGCWFDIKAKTLNNRINKKTWSLDDRAFWILSEVVKCRGQVLSLATFKHPHLDESGNAPQALTEEQIAETISVLHYYLGDEHICLLEYMPTRGVVLHHRHTHQHTKVLDNPNAVMSLGQFVAIVMVLLCALMYMYSGIRSSVSNDVDFSVPIYDRSGAFTQLHIYTDPANHEFIEFHKANIVDHLSQCESLPWDTIAASLSKDRFTINFVLKRVLDDRWQFHNVKVLREVEGERFFTLDWLKEVNICE